MANYTLLNLGLAQTTPFPIGINVTGASGSIIKTSDGRELIDMVAGVGVSNLGHGNQAVVSAIRAQATAYLHVMVYGEFIQESQVRAAKLLNWFLPEILDTVYFVNSGTEAVEAALKLAKRKTGKKKIIAFEGAYHGSTHGSLSVSGNQSRKEAYGPLLPDIGFIRLNQTKDLLKIDSKTAAVILETIQGDAGIRIPDTEFMIALRKRCTKTGALLILDEIQCGIGRTGKMFAFEHFGIEPDLLVLGKALGAGMPIGALVTSRDLMKLFTFDPMLGHITTFGGHPVACAAAAAGLELYKDGQILAGVEPAGAYIESRLQGLSGIVAIRRIGLFMAVELESEENVSAVVDLCFQMGVIVFRFLSSPNALRISPPLVIKKDDLRRACDIIALAIEQINSVKQ